MISQAPLILFAYPRDGSNRTKLIEEAHISKKTLIVAAAITALGGAGALGLQTANAATDSSTTDPMSSLVQKIADKFNLKKADVQSVFDAQRDEMETKREEQTKERLAQAVKDGKLTQDQADKITAKLAEMKTQRDSLKDKTETERHAAMDAARTALEKWASENNIPMEYLHPGGHGGPRPGNN